MQEDFNLKLKESFKAATAAFEEVLSRRDSYNSLLMSDISKLEVSGIAEASKKLAFEKRGLDLAVSAYRSKLFLLLGESELLK